MIEKRLVFDIGANNGHDAAVYLEHGCKVVAVEANPDLCAELRQRFAAEIASGQFVLVDKAISRRRRVTFYINTSDHEWGTILPSYAEHGRKLRGELRAVEVETTTVIDLIREHGVPHRMKVDIEGVDYLCLLDLFDSDLPAHLSIERPKSFGDQTFVLGLLHRLGYTQFAFVDQTADDNQDASTLGLFIDDLPPSVWKGFLAAKATNLQLFGVRALSAVARRTPGLRSMAPRGRWFDIHVNLAAPAMTAERASIPSSDVEAHAISASKPGWRNP
jgi:FkbM family methyltransferase